MTDTPTPTEDPHAPIVVELGKLGRFVIVLDRRTLIALEVNVAAVGSIVRKLDHGTAGLVLCAKALHALISESPQDPGRGIPSLEDVLDEAIAIGASQIEDTLTPVLVAIWVGTDKATAAQVRAMQAAADAADQVADQVDGADPQEPLQATLVEGPGADTPEPSEGAPAGSSEAVQADQVERRTTAAVTSIADAPQGGPPATRQSIRRPKAQGAPQPQRPPARQG